MVEKLRGDVGEWFTISIIYLLLCSNEELTHKIMMKRVPLYPAFTCKHLCAKPKATVQAPKVSQNFAFL